MRDLAAGCPEPFSNPGRVTDPDRHPGGRRPPQQCVLLRPHRKPAPPFQSLFMLYTHLQLTQSPRIPTGQRNRPPDHCPPASLLRALPDQQRNKPRASLPHPCQLSSQGQTEHLHRGQAGEEEGKDGEKGQVKHREVTWKPPLVRLVAPLTRPVFPGPLLGAPDPSSPPCVCTNHYACCPGRGVGLLKGGTRTELRTFSAPEAAGLWLASSEFSGGH